MRFQIVENVARRQEEGLGIYLDIEKAEVKKTGREGLIPVRKTVNRGGKTYQSTYWVRPKDLAKLTGGNAARFMDEMAKSQAYFKAALDKLAPHLEDGGKAIYEKMKAAGQTMLRIGDLQMKIGDYARQDPGSRDQLLAAINGRPESEIPTKVKDLINSLYRDTTTTTFGKDLKIEGVGSTTSGATDFKTKVAVERDQTPTNWTSGKWASKFKDIMTNASAKIASIFGARKEGKTLTGQAQPDLEGEAPKKQKLVVRTQPDLVNEANPSEGGGMRQTYVSGAKAKVAKIPKARKPRAKKEKKAAEKSFIVTDIDKSWKGDSERHSEAAKKHGTQKQETSSGRAKRIFADMGFNMNDLRVRTGPMPKRGFAKTRIRFDSEESKNKAWENREKIAKYEFDLYFAHSSKDPNKILGANAESSESLEHGKVLYYKPNTNDVAVEKYKTYWAESKDKEKSLVIDIEKARPGLEPKVVQAQRGGRSYHTTVYVRNELAGHKTEDLQREHDELLTRLPIDMARGDYSSSLRLGRVRTEIKRRANKEKAKKKVGRYYDDVGYRKSLGPQTDLIVIDKEKSNGE